MNELALFAGAGGGILGSMLLGWRTVAAVEIDEYARQVLLQRQADGYLYRFPIWDDVRTFDGCPWRGTVDIITGGFPCQDTSCAGKRAGLDGSKSGLWSEMVRIIGEARPRYVLVENVQGLINRGLDRVVDSLESEGYGGAACIASALSIDGYHVRNRIWILADASRVGWSWRGCVGPKTQAMEYEGLGEEPFRERAIESGIDGTCYGVAHRVDRLKAIGNGQIPAMVVQVWGCLNDD